MTPIVRADNRDVWFGRLERPFAFESPFGGQEFVLLLVTAGGGVTAGEQAAICDQIVRQGCRYAVCAGPDCELWHDNLDDAFLSTDPNFDPPEEREMMTSWHDGEPLVDVVWFFLNCTSFDSFIAERFLILAIGIDAAAEREVIDAVTSSLASS